MALTAEVKRELARVEVTKTGVRKAEVSSMLRFSGGLHIIAGRIAVEAELDNSLSADRLRVAIADLYGFYSDIVISGASFNKHATKYIVRVLGDGESLARQTGLLDNRGRPVRGLPANLVNGSQEDTVAIWRGAFLARGSLTEPGRSATLEITCPGSESALALVGAARRLNVIAKAREVRNVDRVVIRDSDVIANLLDLLGAKITAAQWRDSRSGREVRVGVNRLANFDDANLRRSAQAAVAAGARVARALQILGEEAPDHLRYAGQLRLEHKQASLDELGRLAEPQMTKDAIAGRIRRLLSMADKRARELGIQDTEVSVLAEGER